MHPANFEAKADTSLRAFTEPEKHCGIGLAVRNWHPLNLSPIDLAAADLAGIRAWVTVC